jgi:hypothetical protein
MGLYCPVVLSCCLKGGVRVGMQMGGETRGNWGIRKRGLLPKVLLLPILL